MSLSLSRDEWQPLVERSVFVASSSRPKSVWLGNKCNRSFWYQWCVGLRVACGRGFLRSVPHHSLLELVRPRKWDLLGITKALLRQMEIRPASCYEWTGNGRRRPNAVVIVTFRFLPLILFNPVERTHFNLGNLTLGKFQWISPWQTCSPKRMEWKKSGRVCHLSQLSQCALLQNAVKV